MNMFHLSIALYFDRNVGAARILQKWVWADCFGNITVSCLTLATVILAQFALQVTGEK